MDIKCDGLTFSTLVEMSSCKNSIETLAVVLVHNPSAGVAEHDCEDRQEHVQQTVLSFSPETTLTPVTLLSHR